MAVDHFLALDLGAESGRAILGTLDGGKLSLIEKHRFANPSGKILGRFRWNLLAQWEEVKTGLRKTYADLDGELAGIGVDTWGVDFGLIAASGQMLGNPIMYRDPGTDGVMERTFTTVPREKIFDATGVQLMQINTLFQLVAMKERGSKILDAAQTLLFMPDLFNYLLCGSKKANCRSHRRARCMIRASGDGRRKSWNCWGSPRAFCRRSWHQGRCWAICARMWPRNAT